MNVTPEQVSEMWIAPQKSNEQQSRSQELESLGITDTANGSTGNL